MASEYGSTWFPIASPFLLEQPSSTGAWPVRSSRACCRGSGQISERHYRAWRKCGGCHALASKSNRGVRESGQVLCRKPPSYGDFQHAVLVCGLRLLDIHREATLDGLVEIFQQLLEGIAFRGTAGDGWHFRPI